MKKAQQIFFCFWILLFPAITNGQGVISSLTTEGNSKTPYPSCGGFELIKNVDHKSHGFIDLSDQFMDQLTTVISNQQRTKNNQRIYEIPIVFHIVHNNNQENIPDSVIFNQVEILNECFRRKNADTSNTREEFLDLVGDAKIEFKLADTDPNGAPSNGITRTNTSVAHFGGVLPYGPGQDQQINDWANDSLYYNLFRLTNSTLGGKDAWDTELYLNVWIGDLRILLPKFGNFEELVFFGLATPPVDHVNWPDTTLDVINVYEQGVLLHYVNVGSNNPNRFPIAYNAFNGVVNTGKILVHEVGHYLGLRHIWGDGDCSMDDFIDDTPNSDASSEWDCNISANSCVDSIENKDLLNMVENYMDYSSGDCQNSFTNGQIDLMRSVLRNYRPQLLDTVSSIASNAIPTIEQLKCYPNPTNGELYVELGQFNERVQINIQNYIGQSVHYEELENVQTARFQLDLNPGIYFLNVVSANNKKGVAKIIVK